jgi:hypothetical protein
MKKVAATKGQRVRRMDFFFGWWAWGAAVSEGCGMLVDAVAVANFYGFLLKRLTLTTASPYDVLSQFPGWSDSRAFSVKLVRKSEITGNLQRCKKFFKKTGKRFVKEDSDGGNRWTAVPPARITARFATVGKSPMAAPHNLRIALPTERLLFDQTMGRICG